MFCNLCKKNHNKLLKLNEKFLDTELSKVVKNILAVQASDLPVRFLICTECALSLLQTEMVISRLRIAILNVKHAANIPTIYKQMSTTGENDDSEESGDENNLDVTKNVSEAYLSAFGSEPLLLDWTFRCTHCGYTSNKAKWYKRHLITKHQLKHGRIYQCPYCKESYKRLLHLKNHINSVHGNKPLKRPRRKTSLLSRNSNIEYEISGNESDHKNDPYEFECSVCDYKTIDTQVFKTHLEIKHEIKDSKIYKCKKCPLKFKRISALDNHIACKHDDKPKRYSYTESRKSVPKNFERVTVGSEEIEINDVKNEEVSDAETEVYLACKQCAYEAQDINDLQRHQNVKHQNGEIVKGNTILLDTLNDDKKESNEQRPIEIGKVDKQVDNMKINPISGNVMVCIPVQAAAEEGQGAARNFQSSRSFQAFPNTKSDKELTKITQNTGITPSDARERINKLNSVQSKTRSLNKFPDTENDEPLMVTQGPDMTQSDSEEHSNKINLHTTLSKIPSFPKFRDTQSDEPLMSSDSEEHSNKLNLHSTLSKTPSFPKFRDTQNDEPLMISDSNEHSNKLNFHSTLSTTQSFPKFRDTQNDEPLMISQIALLTQSDSEEHSSQTPEKNVGNKYNLHSTLKKTPNDNVDIEKSDTKPTFETPKKMMPQRIDAIEISKTDWVFLCSYCDFESTQRKAYKEHTKFEHNLDDENIYKCLYCTASFVRYKLLKTHIGTMHAMDLTATCETPATFSDSSQDQSRYTRQRGRKRKNSAEVIKENESSTAEANVNPMQLAKRKKVLSCVVCGKIFSSAEKLQKHVNKLHSADEMCQQ